MIRATILFAATLLPAVGIAAPCDWSNPGANPFRGNVADAIEHYTDIPAGTRAALRAKIRAGHADEVVAIRRDSIDGFEPDITAMHFGRGKICEMVTRAGWSVGRIEMASAYCVDGECVIVPHVCNNLSRVRRVVASAGRSVAVVTGSFQAQPLPQQVAWKTPEPLPPARVDTYSPIAPPLMQWAPSHEPAITGPIPAIPEPETWAMILTGIGIIFWWKSLRKA